MLEEKVPTELKVLLTLTGTLTSLLKHTTEDPAPGCLSRRCIVKMIYFKLWVLYFQIRNPCAHMLPHATSRIGEMGLKIFNGFLIFFNGFPIFLNGFPIFLNSFLLPEKSKKIYLRQEVYKRSLFELCIFCHLLSHLRSKLHNTRYNTQHTPVVHLCSQQCAISKI